MNETAIVEIILHGYWHAGSGEGRSADADALVLKDQNGLPWLPGRTLKGLLRDAVRTCEEAGAVRAGATDVLFGRETRKGEPDGSVPGRLRVGNAVLSEAVCAAIARSEEKAGLYDTFASTRIDAEGLAEDKTLRTIELAVPVTLWAEVALLAPDVPESGAAEDGSEALAEEWFSVLEKACGVLRRLGSGRNRGLGRCTCRLKRGGRR